MKLLITRSEPGASRMAAELAAAGIDSWVQPLLAAVPSGQPLPAPPVSAQTSPPSCHESSPGSGAGSAECFDLVICVSEHAVVHAAAELANLGDGVQWYAIGPTTGAALSAILAPRTVVRVPALARSEGLLAESGLQELTGQRVLLIAGEDGRDLIEQTLQQRGALVVPWWVYKRQPLVTDGGAALPWSREAVGTIDACVASSGQGLELLTRQWLAVGGSVEVPVCVPSPRIEKLAGKLGWRTTVVCAGASAAATAAGLQDHLAQKDSVHSAGGQDESD